MITHNVQQGSEAWNKLRSEHKTASEAAAMLGLSKHQSRNDLLKQKATGLTEEVTPQKQRLFDAGHDAEAKARPIAEELIDAELFPCTATDDSGNYLASFDGIDIMESIVWEHKLFNLSLAGSLAMHEVPDTHWPQLEQQILVSGADRAMLMCSDGTNENMAYTWYESVPERRQQLIEGWKQFDTDINAYKHKESAVVTPGTAPDALPTLNIKVKGMVTQSNLNAFKDTAQAVISGIKTDLQTDTDFADAEKTAKWLKDVEGKLEQAKEQALSQTADIDAIFKTIDSIKEEAREKRLSIGKLVKTRKDSIKATMMKAGIDQFHEFVITVDESLNPYFLSNPAISLATAIKGKRTIESIQNAIDTTLAMAKIDINKQADLMRINSKLFTEEYRFLFSDAQTLISKDTDDLKLIIDDRINTHKEKEAEREQAQRERFEREQARREKEVHQVHEIQPQPDEAKEELPAIKHKSREQQIYNSIMASFIATGLSIELSKTLIERISTGEIPHVEINFQGE